MYLNVCPPALLASVKVAQCCTRRVRRLFHRLCVCACVGVASFLAVAGSALHAQGLHPLVTQYAVADAGLDARKILAMATLPGGTLALGTEDGVWQFDGAQYSPLWQRDDYNVTALAVTESGSLFLGGRGKLAVLKPAETGYTYTDLTATLEAKQKNFATIEKLLLHAGRVYAYCAQHVFAFDAKTHKLLFVLTAGKQLFAGFVGHKSKVYVNLAGQGLHEIQTGQFIPAANAQRFSSLRIRFANELPGGKGMLLGCEDKLTGTPQLFRYDVAQKEVRQFASAVKPLWEARGMVEGVLLPNGRVAVATKNRGIIILDAASGRTLAALDSTTGLPNENIHAMTAAADGGLWLSSDDGPCHVATALPILSLPLRITAQPFAITESGTHQYIATQSGVYALPNNKLALGAGVTNEQAGGAFAGEVESEIVDRLERQKGAKGAGLQAEAGLSKVQGLEGVPVLKFIHYNGSLLVPTLRGVFEIAGTTAILVALDKYAVQQLLPASQPDRLIALAGSDVVVLQQVNKKWVERSRVEVSKGANLMQGVLQPGLPNVAFVASSKGVFRLQWKNAELTGSPGIAQAVLPARGKGAGTQFLTLADSVYAVTASSAYVFANGNWLPAPALKPYLSISPIQVINRGKEAWVKSNRWVFRFSSVAGQMKVDTCFTALVLPETENWIIQPDARHVGAVARVGGKVNLYQFPWRVSPSKQVPLAPRLSATIQDVPMRMKGIPEVPANKGEVQVRMQVPLYTHPQNLLYQHKLEGLQQNWSALKHERSIAIETLYPGSYTLLARAYCYYGASPISAWSFSIPVPWYATYWAYALYVLGGIGLFIGAVRYRSWTLERQKRLLADEVKSKTQELQLAKGDLEVKNEQLTQNAEQLQERLQIINERDKALEAYNQRLVQTTEEIEEKNRTLLVQKEQLEQANHAIQESQEQLVKQERDAAIGRLVAQVAHEINSPIGAIKGTAQGLLTSLPQTIQQVPRLLRTQPDAVSDCFIQLVSTALNHEDNYSTREERKLRGEYEEALAATDLEPNATEYADALVKLGSLGDVQQYLPLLRAPNALQLIESAISIVKIGRSARKIRDAVESTQRIVVNLKLTAYHETSDEMQEYDLPETIDRILTLYNYNVKQGIELDKQYQQVPILWGYPHELGQVWNNLISNAVHAMQNKGKITIRVAQPEPGWVTVNFKDNGPGIPQEVVDKIFDQFFTTKGRGEGTGLGLFISKRIIEKHSGVLLVNSRAGETEFIARLPILPAPSLASQDKSTTHPDLSAHTSIPTI